MCVWHRALGIASGSWPRVECTTCRVPTRPWVHYVPLAEDFSEADLKQLLLWLNEHPQHARQIAEACAAGSALRTVVTVSGIQLHGQSMVAQCCNKHWVTVLWPCSRTSVCGDLGLEEDHGSTSCNGCSGSVGAGSTSRSPPSVGLSHCRHIHAHLEIAVALRMRARARACEAEDGCRRA